MDKPITSMIDTIAKTCVAVRLRLLNRVITNFYDEALRPLGLKVSQLNILIVTAKLGLGSDFTHVLARFTKAWHCHFRSLDRRKLTLPTSFASASCRQCLNELASIKKRFDHCGVLPFEPIQGHDRHQKRPSRPGSAYHLLEHVSWKTVR